MNSHVDAPRSVARYSFVQPIHAPVKRFIHYLVAALIFMFVGNAYAVIKVELTVENDLDINGIITVIEGGKVKVTYTVIEDTDKDLNKNDKIQLMRVSDDSVVSSVKRGPKKTGSVSLKVRNSVDEQLYVRYIRKTGTEIARTSHPADPDFFALLSIAKASLTELTTGLNGLENTMTCKYTCRGTYTTVFTATAAGDRGSSAFSFGTTLASAPIVHFIAEGGTPPAACPGTASMPEADPGHLCVYESEGGNSGSQCITSQSGMWTCDIADRFGAALYARATGPGNAFTVGTWAVTAP